MKNFFDINELSKILSKNSNPLSTQNQSTSQSQENVLRIDWSFLSTFFSDPSQNNDSIKTSATPSFDQGHGAKNGNDFLKQSEKKPTPNNFFAPAKNEPASESAFRPAAPSENFSTKSLSKFDDSIKSYSTSTLSLSQASTISLNDSISAYSGSIYPPSLGRNIDDDELSQCSDFSEESLKHNENIQTQFLEPKIQITIKPPETQAKSSVNSSWTSNISSSLSSIINTISFWKKSPSPAAIKKASNENEIPSPKPVEINSQNKGTLNFSSTQPSPTFSSIEAKSPSPIAFFGPQAKEHVIYKSLEQHKKNKLNYPYSYPSGSKLNLEQLPSQPKKLMTAPPSIFRSRSSGNCNFSGTQNRQKRSHSI